MMTIVFTVLAIIIGLLCICFFANKVKHKSMYPLFLVLTSMLFVLMPIDQLPWISDTPLGVLKLVQVCTLVVAGLFLYLLQFKKSDILNVRLSYTSVFLFLFILFSIPSLFFVQNISQLFKSGLSTGIALCALFFISNFLPFSKKIIQYFAYSTAAVIIFGYFQFITDMIGAPRILSGLREGYTKEVFGIPRMHATFAEPAYYANFLLFPLFVSLFLLYYELDLFPKVTKWISYKTGVSTAHALLLQHGVISTIILITILLTLAKSTWLVLPIYGITVGIIGAKIITKKKLWSLVAKCVAICCVLLSFAWFITDFSNNNIYIQIEGNIRATFDGTSATSAERTVFLQAAQEVVPEYIITGVGPGQFGVYAQPYFKHILVATDSNPEDQIVLNTYFEVLLEYGLLSFLVFMFLIITTLVHSTCIWYKMKNRKNIYAIMIASGVLYLVSTLIQWWYISPVYFLPFFVVLGLLQNIINRCEEYTI